MNVINLKHLKVETNSISDHDVVKTPEPEVESFPHEYGVMESEMFGSKYVH